MKSTTSIRGTFPLPARLGVIGGLVLASLVPAGAAFADDPFEPMPLPGLEDDHPVITPPGGYFDPFEEPDDIPIQTGGYNGNGGNGGNGQNPAQPGTPQDAETVQSGTTEAALAPVAVADAYETSAGEAIDVTVEHGLLANDSGDRIVAEYVEQSADGAIGLEQDGSFRYEPADGFAGTDTFRYRVLDAEGRLSEPATVSIVVAPAVVPAADQGSGVASLLAGIGLSVGALALTFGGGALFLRFVRRRNAREAVA